MGILSGAQTHTVVVVVAGVVAAVDRRYVVLPFLFYSL